MHHQPGRDHLGTGGFLPHPPCAAFARFASCTRSGSLRPAVAGRPGREIARIRVGRHRPVRPGGSGRPAMLNSDESCPITRVSEVSGPAASRSPRVLSPPPFSPNANKGPSPDAHAEWALRGIAPSRDSWMFADSDCGGERAAAMHTLIVTAKLGRRRPAGLPRRSHHRGIGAKSQQPPSEANLRARFGLHRSVEPVKVPSSVRAAHRDGQHQDDPRRRYHGRCADDANVGGKAVP